MRGEGARRNIRFLSRFAFPADPVALFVISICTIIASCGFPEVDYLFPPSQFFTSGKTSLILAHNIENIDDFSDIFMGYELYYRIFENRETAEEKLTNIKSLAKTYNYSPSGFMNAAASSTYGPFLRMCKKVYPSESSSTYYFSYSRPLIEVKDNSIKNFNLNLNTWFINESYEEKIVRNISDYGRADFDNSSNYRSTDEDFVGGNDSLSVIYIICFAVAYGYSSSTLSPIYSTPVILDSVVEYSLPGS